MRRRQRQSRKAMRRRGAGVGAGRESEGSVLDNVGTEITSLVVPVSLCMFLVVLLVRSLTPHGVGASVPSVATLVYAEKASDSNSTKLEGAVLNSLVFVAVITAVTFLLVLLYYYRCIKFLKWYMCASATMVLAYMGGAIFVELIRVWSLPVDAITFSVALFNFTVVGVLSIFLSGLPILITQFYLVMIGMLVAFWFTMLPEWTTWVLLVAMAMYDLVAVLAPGGPLNLLVELAMTRDEEIPALIYESRPTTTPPVGQGVSESGQRRRRSRKWKQWIKSRARIGSNSLSADSHSNSTELQPVNSSSNRNSSLVEPHTELSPPSVGALEGFISGRSSSTEIVTMEEEMRPLMNLPSQPTTVIERVGRVQEEHEPSDEEEEGGLGLSASGAVKLGLGDFVFYSVLVGRAAMYDLTTVYACYLAIIAGLGSTLVLLAVARRALPALPISICLGVVFYFLTRLLLEPLITNTSTNLVMF